MPSPIVLPDEDLVNVFANLEVELRRLVGRCVTRGTPRAEATRIAEEIVTLVRCRWDAPSLHQWWEVEGGKDWSAVGLNSLYARLRELGVDMRRLLLAVARAYGWLEQAWLIIDDTSQQKYGVWMRGVCSVHVANVHGSVLGHNVVTLMVAGGDGALFIDQRLKVNPSAPRLARHAGRPEANIREARKAKKWEMALEMLARARAAGLDQAWVLFDCGYFNAEVARRLSSPLVPFITKAKSNTRFLIKGVWMTAKEFQTSLKSWKRVGKTDHMFFQCEACLPNGVKVKLVATWFFRGRSLKKTCAVLVTNKLDLSGAQVVLAYTRRWQTERGYEDWKGVLGGMDFHTTNFEAIGNHVWIGFLAYALARRARQLAAPDLGLPTVLALRRKAHATMMATGKLLDQEAQTTTRRAA